MVNRRYRIHDLQIGSKNRINSPRTIERCLDLEEVGGRVGYPDIHYFSRIFRRHEGISPSEYRKLSNIL
ncbi:AraC family transcriptional regulator [Paenibacillus sp. Soil522]|uniref:AraC family transcriptional regulator n=1 Tax=Paenibacillus sp. Soil522 TaxID=1736388 RepID=UPI000AA402D4|nr:AraC family transcriptional regulator [Paenibacillus sp. Soil522]